MKPETNVFGQRVCDTNCPAWCAEYGICDAGQSFYGRLPIAKGSKEIICGRLCNLPIDYDLVVRDDPLFKWGEFTSHSGQKLDYKIEGDALSDATIDGIAAYIASKTDFGLVWGVPRGGCRLADALEPYAVWEAPFDILIVDDVLTTGASMVDMKANLPPQVHEDDVRGWVIFARGPLPKWVNAVFRVV